MITDVNFAALPLAHERLTIKQARELLAVPASPATATAILFAVAGEALDNIPIRFLKNAYDTVFQRLLETTPEVANRIRDLEPSLDGLTIGMYRRWLDELGRGIIFPPAAHEMLLAAYGPVVDSLPYAASKELMERIFATLGDERKKSSTPPSPDSPEVETPHSPTSS